MTEDDKKPAETVSAQSLVSAPEPAPKDVPSPDGARREQTGLKEWRKWKARGDKESFAALARSVAPAIDRVAKANPKINPSLLRAKAKPLLLNAASTYDPSAGTAFTTHLSNHLKPLTIRSHGETRAVAKGRFVEETARDYKRAFDEFNEDRMREPTAQEMAEIMGISRERSSELMRRIRSYEVPEGAMEGAAIPEDRTAEARRLRMWTEYVYNSMSPRDQLVMDYRTGRNGKPQLKLSEIAEKTGISVAMVHKILNKAASEIIEGVSSMGSGALKASPAGPDAEASGEIDDADILPKQ